MVETPEQVADLLEKNAEALLSWTDSVFEQRNSFGYQLGVEADARDALMLANRVQVSVCAALMHLAGLARALAKENDRGE